MPFRISRGNRGLLDLPAASKASKTAAVFALGACIVLLLALFVVLVNAAADLRNDESENVPPSQYWQTLLDKYSNRTDTEALLVSAASYANLGQLEESLAKFKELERSADYREFAHEVIKKYGAVLEEDSDNKLALNSLAFAYYALDDYSTAAGYFEQLIALEPTNVWMRHFAALSYDRANDIDRGMNHLTKALEIDPNNQYTHFLLSAGYYKKKMYIQALYHYLKAPDVRKRLAEISEGG